MAMTGNTIYNQISIGGAGSHWMHWICVFVENAMEKLKWIVFHDINEKQNQLVCIVSAFFCWFFSPPSFSFHPFALHYKKCVTEIRRNLSSLCRLWYVSLKCSTCLYFRYHLYLDWSIYHTNLVRNDSEKNKKQRHIVSELQATYFDS